MRLKIFIAALAFLFTVKLASAQISFSSAGIANTGPTNHFVLNIYGESLTAYVVGAYIQTSPYPPNYYGVATGVSGLLNSVNSWTYTTPGTFEGDLYVNWSGYGSAGFYIDVAMYDATTDRMWYETHYASVWCN